jgi:hypothetical protein
VQEIKTKPLRLFGIPRLLVLRLVQIVNSEGRSGSCEDRTNSKSTLHSDGKAFLIVENAKYTMNLKVERTNSNVLRGVV